METLRIAVIGAGPRARAYMATITKLTDFYNFCAICDLDPQRGQAAAEKYDVKGRYTKVEEMLIAEKPDVLFCLTPTDSLNVMALTAASHKINVITEIPIAIALPVADAIIQKCRENGVKYEIAENVWRWPHEQLKQKIIEIGLLGDLTHARLCYTSGSYHGFNAIRMLLGSEAKRVLGYAGEVPVLPYISYGGGQETTSKWESGIIEFQNGVLCLYEMPPRGGPRSSSWDIEGTHGYLSGNELVLYRNGERVHYPIQSVNTEVDGEQVLDCVRVDTEPPIVWENPFKKYKVSETDEIAKASILYSMYRAVTEDIEPEYGATNARADLELWIALRESALRGSVWMDLPIQDLTELESRIMTEYRRRYGHDPIEGICELLNATFGRLSVIWTVAGWL
ncbi:TPA: Gfo/Idh/MocA family oxidoreductase [Candidatus Poribacteria bacterium]|nr:Gfo/Idh/MocA family oxidoreductase [Candidatus Poribacteria bacterium]